MRAPKALLRPAALSFAIAIGALVAACNGCHHTGKPSADGAGPTTDVGVASVRVYVVSDLAGALEPCGCQKDMLGGVDRFAALVTRDQAKAKGAIVVSAGPLFFMDSTIKPERLEQETWKAEAIAAGLKSTGLAAFAPGKNDFAAGSMMLEALQNKANGALVAANLHAIAPSTLKVAGHVVRDVGGIKIAIVGVSLPRRSAEETISDLTIDDAAKALSAEAKKARDEGARIVVGVAAMDRGAAVRAAEGAQDLDLLAVGSPSTEGDGNDDGKAPVLVGNVLVVEPSNHLQRTAAIDFYARDQGRFGDGSNLQRAADVADLQRQIDELARKLVAWQLDPTVLPKDVEAQRARLEGLRGKLVEADKPIAPPSGSFFRYELVELRDSLGKDKAAVASMASYYQRVNAFNRDKFAGRRAPAPARGEPEFVGAESCKPCHAAPYDVWSKTKHATAYKTLADESKEFNLDCVGCHVTGYEKPGGSTVTDVKSLEAVQCESCHGPGSAHVVDPHKAALPTELTSSLCESCHHPPHSSAFEFKARRQLVRGPGHGMPGAPMFNVPPKAWVSPKPRFPG
ncbi:MAG: multiheme c-type cytochrome [Polyangiales bacterium]